mmetsp:Transcript_28141/g.41446  ORF Transcript_28141/g.41446 Transcript_28141/m.41446 type:complete len:203 (-) Transcript_28141:259-867(-)
MKDGLHLRLLNKPTSKPLSTNAGLESDFVNVSLARGTNCCVCDVTRTSAASNLKRLSTSVCVLIRSRSPFQAPSSVPLRPPAFLSSFKQRYVCLYRLDRGNATLGIESSHVFTIPIRFRSSISGVVVVVVVVVFVAVFVAVVYFRLSPFRLLLFVILVQIAVDSDILRAFLFAFPRIVCKQTVGHLVITVQEFVKQLEHPWT